MKKKPKSNPKKPKKAAAKKPVPKKPAPKKPAKAVAKKTIKKVAPKKVKVAAKPLKKVLQKPVVKAKPAPKKPEPKKVTVPKAQPKIIAKTAPKTEAKESVPKPVVKPKRLPPPPKKRFVVLPPRPLVPSEIKDEGKVPKGLYKLEYIVTSSPDVLFEFLSTAGGLEKWFAPRVYLKENIFVFSWGNDELKQANLLALREREFVRFRWLDQADKNILSFVYR